MITKENLKDVLKKLNFKPNSNETKFKKHYQDSDKIFIEVDFKNSKIIYSPIDNSFKEKEFPSLTKPSNGIIIHRNTTTNFNAKENFVCLICMDNLLAKGYKPQHIIIEPAVEVGHVNKPSYGDIMVYNENYERLVLIENKTYGSEFSKEWNNMQKDGGQLFSYLPSLGSFEYVCLYAADFDHDEIIYNCHLITLKDNEEYLKTQNANIKQDKDKKPYFKDAKNKSEYFKVWNESYQMAMNTRGLFESDIAAYKIGKEKYTLNDLNKVPYSNIRAIYNEFATILRNNAIGNYENTFYILVDLFLCKIIDEKNMQNGKSDELKFYWKGFGYDNPLDYCDRLLELYAQGKKELFEVDVVNISKGKIDEIFNTKQRYKGELHDEIDRLFKEQKFYNIKKFNFIEVENKQEFDLNFKVLLHIASLIQDIYITKSENNQFLGDLFEGFLNRSIHQTEGRFFTPTPITNFIINSLPEFNAGSKILDYACGAGHFLTEFIQHNENCKIYGIEKNKNLSMVAKIATVFYDNKNEAKIVFQDALSTCDNTKDYAKYFKNDTFDLIISNPPYSVKGFLETLLQQDRKNFTLLSSVDETSFDKNNAIECFFIERTAQLLKNGGYFALVLPSSILNKGGIYEKTREILLQNFDILSIVGLNSRTFGSTGTQTVIIFAKKREKNANDLISCFLDDKFQTSNEFENHAIIHKYCEFKNYDYKDFVKFLKDENLSQELAKTQTFANYKAEFENTSSKSKEFKKEPMTKTKQEQLFENSSFFSKNLSKTKEKEKFNEFLASDEFGSLEQDFYQEQFIKKCKIIELQKLKFYIFTQNNELLLIKSPEDKKQDTSGGKSKTNKDEIVKFLGYDWSNRKGDEGIKYITNVADEGEFKENKDDSDDEKKEKEALRNINSVKFIQTPLYNPQNKDDKSKICYAIKSFFNNNLSNALLKSLDSNNPNSYTISKTSLINLIDFENASFDKVINLSTKSKVEIVSKFPLVKLETLIKTIETGSRPVGGVGNLNDGALSLGGEHIHNTNGVINLVNSKFVSVEYYEANPKGRLKQNDILLCKDGALTGKIALLRDELNNKKAMINEHIFILRTTDLNIQKYVFYFLYSPLGQQILKQNITGAAQGGLNSTNLKNIKIPFDQKAATKIVAECEKVDNEFKTIRMEIDELKTKMSEIFAKFGISFETNEGGGTS
ncbi:N-6 DNA methylase [Campylobacter sp. M4]|uniref:N-6 DNA methylase n=1 Tax=Campylobacter sp. M4 TaxID=3424761 RepID=UPI003D340084